ncbi:MAG: FG-GAP repeat protein [Candidatus Gracilibacteria bacterium]|nr:FG-GAP repeat protein [Candidatus Gracilibacteria bacterium]
MAVFATTWSETAQSTATDHAANDGFGRSVAVSGTTSIYGSPYTEVGEIRDAGAAYVMLDSVQQTKLTASDAAEIDYFGFAVALDTDTAAVGAYGADAGGKQDSGAVYIFTRSGTTWSQVAKLTASDAAVGDQFGVSLALQDGTLVIGAHQKNSGAGAAYVFTGSGNSWSERKILNGGVGEGFGVAVALDSSTILVGAPTAASATGAAYVFVGTGGVWLQQSRLTASDGAAGDMFGLHLSISGDRALIAAEYATIDEKVDAGASYLFTRALLSWSQTNKITASDATAGMQFGSSVALDNNTALVGAYRAGASGAVYNFHSGDSSFEQESKQTPTSNISANGLFGSAVAISRNTLTAVVGAVNNSFGAAYVILRTAAITAGFFGTTSFDNATFQ